MGPSRSRTAAAGSRGPPISGRSAGESVDGRSITIYDAATKKALRTLRVPSGLWLLDMVMVDGGTVVAPMLPGVPSDPGPLVGCVGRDPLRRVGTGRHGAEVAGRGLDNALRGDVWFGTVLSPDHRTLLLPNAPSVGQAMLVNVHNGRELTLPGGASAPLMGGAFSPDGSLVATSGDDGSTRLWNATTGSLVSSLARPRRQGVGAGLLHARRPPDAGHRRASTAR